MLLESTEDFLVSLTAPHTSAKPVARVSYIFSDRPRIGETKRLQEYGEFDDTPDFDLAPEKSDDNKRTVEAMLVFNADSVSNTMTFRIRRGAVDLPVYECTLRSRELLKYSYPEGFKRMEPTEDTLEDIWNAILALSSSSPVGTNDVSLLANANLAQYDVVTSNGLVANSGTLAHRDKVVGLATAAIANGFTGVVRVGGEIQNAAWAWTPGDVLYLNGAGTLSTTAPSSGFVQRIATAHKSDTIVIEIGRPVRL